MRHLCKSLLITLSASIVFATESDWEDSSWGDSWYEAEESLLYGFVELGYSEFIDSNNRSDRPLEEIRWRLEWKDKFSGFNFSVKADLYYDKVILDSSSQLSGRFRETSLDTTFGDNVDVKLGRQVLTWGTGDLLFINDLFPKDWQSFFSGRDDEYLKAPSDAIKLSWYSAALNIDLVITPEFDGDNYLNGDRLSFWLPNAGIAQPNPPVNAQRPETDDWELATRIYSKVKSLEWAVYGYRGFYKSPNGVNAQGQPYFPRLNVLGASVRNALGQGIGYFETGYYQSVSDKDGVDPFIPNSQWQYLLGYEVELAKNLSGTFQYYVEHTKDHANLIAQSLMPSYEPHQRYQMITARITQQALQQNLINSMVIFYSPTESDWHLRLKSEYRFDDNWKIALGYYHSNGNQPHTFWSQFQENSTVWLRVRYNY